jgi:hypothetical protein
MSLSNALETSVLKWQMQGVDDLAAVTDWYVSLHSADPGEAGSQTTSEVAYTGYARVAVERSADGWTVAGDSVENAVEILFGECTAGSATASYWAVGTASSGAGSLGPYGRLKDSLGVNQDLAISPGVAPRFPAGALVGTQS